MLGRALFSSASAEWETPREFCEELDREFRFDLDVCARPENAKCERHFTPEDDGLKRDWAGVCYMNPPYGKEIAKWVKKAYEEAQKGATVVCLLPARTDTSWWHEHVMKAREIRFVRGRLKFGDAKNGAPFPSAVVVFAPGEHVPVVKSVNVSGKAWEGRGETVFKYCGRCGENAVFSVAEKEEEYEIGGEISRIPTRTWKCETCGFSADA